MSRSFFSSGSIADSQAPHVDLKVATSLSFSSGSSTSALSNPRQKFMRDRATFRYSVWADARRFENLRGCL